MSVRPEITEQDFRRRRGDTKPHRVVISLKSTGLPTDITGYSFLWVVKPTKDPIDTDNTEALLVMTGTIVDAANGVVDFAPDDVAAADITPGKYYFDMQVTDNAGVIGTEMKGKYTIEQDIAK
jgi:hypothetical protein